MTDSFFASISRFVDFINVGYEDIIKSEVYFVGKDSFKNKYDKICVKPVFIELQKKDKKSIYLTNQEIFNIFDGPLVLSFSETNRRKINNETEGDLYKICINFEKKEYNGQTYYNSIVRKVTNKNNIEKITAQIKEFEIEENDIPDEAFFIDNGLNEDDIA